MIEHLPQQENIVIPSNYDLFVLSRIENHGKQKGAHQNVLISRTDANQFLYRSQFSDTPEMRFTAGWAKKAFSLIDRSLEKDLTASGLNDFEWRDDWKDLMEGKTTPAIKTLDLNICKEGHNMIDRFNNHRLCMICGDVKWSQEIT